MRQARLRELANRKGIAFGKPAITGLLSSTALLPAIFAVAAAGLMLSAVNADAQTLAEEDAGGLSGSTYGVPGSCLFNQRKGQDDVHTTCSP